MVSNSFNSLINKDQLTNIKKLFDKVKPHSEFEYIFKNSSKENKLGLESFLKVLNYAKYRASQKLRLTKTVALDVVYSIKDKNNITSYRITINDQAEINRLMETLHIKKNHVVFKSLIGLSEKNKSIKLMKKEKTKDDMVVVPDFDLRVRLAKEVDITPAEKKKLLTLDETTRDNIIFRYKQRTSLYIVDETNTKIQIDLTNTKQHHDINRLERSYPTYELELEYTSNKTPSSKHFDIINNTTTTILKILQQSNHLITKTQENNVLTKYRDILGIKKKQTVLAGRKAQSLEVQHVVEKLPNKYAVTDKADGERYFLIILDNKVYLISYNLHVKDSGIILPKSKSQYNNTIFDGEYIFIGKKNAYIFMVFDCLFESGKDIRQENVFMKRLAHADKVVKDCFVFNKQKYYPLTNYDGKTFDEKKIALFHQNGITKFMSALNHDIDHNNNLLLVRRKYFMPVFGTHGSEIFKYSALMWDKYIFDPNVKTPYALDGLMYHPIDQKYIVSVKDSKYIEYKWKPADKNSIDFYIRIERSKGKILTIYDNSDDNMVHGKPYRIVKLHVGKTFNNVEKPILFKRETGLFEAHVFLTNGAIRDEEGNIIQDDTVVEFYYDSNPNIPETHRWIPMRTRYDKTESVRRFGKKYGNYTDIANKVWRSISNPFTIDDIKTLANKKTYRTHLDALRGKIDHSIIMSEAQENAYYQKKSNLAYPMRQFHNFMKSNIIYTHGHLQYRYGNKMKVLDVACGRGGDIMKWYYANIDYYVGFDLDSNGINSPTDGAKSRYKQMKRKNPSFPLFDFIQADARALLDLDSQKKVITDMSYANEQLIKKYFSPENKTKFDIISVQFAIHYFLINETAWNNFLKNVNSLLKPGGTLICTVFDAERITDVLGEKDNYSVYYTDKKGKKQLFMDIKKKYGKLNRNKPIGVGHAIDFHNAMFSNEGVYLTEYLVDKEFLRSEFLKKCNMELTETDLFDNQFNIHENFFNNAASFESKKETKKFLSGAKTYYNQNDEVNKASMKLTRLNRYYVFKKRSTKSQTKSQKGGQPVIQKVYQLTELSDFFNPTKYYRKDVQDPRHSMLSSIHEVLIMSNKIPQSVPSKEFYKNINIRQLRDDNISQSYMSKLIKNMVIQNMNESGKVETVLNGVNVLVCEKDCDGFTTVSPYYRKTTLDKKVPTILLYKNGNSYQPIYRLKNDVNDGFYSSKSKLVRNLLAD